MIVIKLEMWPHGDEHRKYDLGRAYVWNRGDVSDPNRANYGIAVARKSAIRSPYRDVVTGGKASRTGKVDDYPRLSYSVWRLIIRALTSCFPEEQ